MPVVHEHKFMLAMSATKKGNVVLCIICNLIKFVAMYRSKVCKISNAVIVCLHLQDNTLRTNTIAQTTPQQI